MSGLRERRCEKAGARNGREVCDNQNRLCAVLAIADPGEHRVRRIAAVDPAETVLRAVFLVKRRGFPIERVQIPHEVLHPLMRRIFQQMPVKAGLVVPFTALRKLASHEQQLLARMAPHEPQIGAQIGEPLPVIARHLAKKRPFAMHHFVMGNR